MRTLQLLVIIGLFSRAISASSSDDVATSVHVMVLHTYEAKIRLDGKVSTTQVKASDAGHAKKLVQQQFPGATVLSVKKVD